MMSHSCSLSSYRMILAPLESWNHTSGDSVKADVVAPPSYSAKWPNSEVAIGVFFELKALVWRDPS